MTKNNHHDYPVPTPSALVGALSSVYWKPQFQWLIHSYDVLEPIRWITQQRNEINQTQSLRNAAAGHLVDINEHRVQRQTLMLRDVAYRVRAHIWVHPAAREQDPAKHRDQFHRRVQRGSWFRPPYLGMREHVADVLPDDSNRTAIAEDQDLGLILHTIEYHHNRPDTYTWFHAQMRNGTVEVPAQGSDLATATVGGPA